MKTGNYHFIGYATGKSLPDITPCQAKRLTHLNVAFGIVNDSKVSIEGIRRYLGYIKKIRSYNPNLNILLSTGGGNQHGHGPSTKTDEGIQILIKSTMDIVEEFNFDGIDCDWEFPCDRGIMEEKYQHTKLIKGYRDALDKFENKRNKKCWLTIAAGAGKWYLNSTEIDVIHKYLDFINVMTYDMRCGNQPTGHHTNLYEPEGAPISYSADTAVKLFEEAGVPSEKIVIGVAFYSRRWDGVPNVNKGMHLEAKIPGDFGPDYTAIYHIYEKSLGFIKYWDDKAKAPWLFNGDTFISYDDPESIRYKCEYVKSNGLGGIMYWEHSYDRTGILFNTIYDNLLE
jgi:chitinase